MVCFFSVATNAAISKFQCDLHWDDHTPWNWLIFDLAQFIFHHSSEYIKGREPHIPYDDTSDWGIWFNSVVQELKKEFHDANPERCIKVLENCPAEEVAIMIFCTIDINTVREWIKTCGAG